MTEFFTGPKRTVLAADELIAAVLVEPAAGPQQFAKVGTRNAMVIAVCSFAVALDRGASARRHRNRFGGAHSAPCRRGRTSRGRVALADRCGVAGIADPTLRPIGGRRHVAHR